jgi:transcriptional regulator with XRE-family HTH domain
MTTHDEYIRKLSSGRRAKIKARAQTLIAEERTLQELRKAREHSQEELAEILGIRQGDLSKFEHRTDAYLSTVRRYVEALGGTLDLVASFPDATPVKIIHIGDLAEEPEAPKRSKVAKRA